jgi:outer membrane protein assembly factor BamB
MPFFESDAQNWRWPDREGRILCTSRLNAVSLTDQDKGWTVPLDGRATFGVDHGEALIVSTHHGTIYGIDKRGEIRWTFNAGAEVENLQILPSGDLVILEKGRESVACIRAGKLLWKYKSDGLVAEFEDHPAGVRRFAVADTESTLYFSTESGSSTTFALDRNGKLLWKLPWADYVMNPGLSLDSRGRLFFNFQTYQIKKLARAGVLCIADQDR